LEIAAAMIRDGGKWQAVSGRALLFVQGDAPAIAPGSPETLTTSDDGGKLWKNGYRHVAPRFGLAWRPAKRRSRWRASPSSGRKTVGS